MRCAYCLVGGGLCASPRAVQAMQKLRKDGDIYDVAVTKDEKEDEWETRERQVQAEDTLQTTRNIKHEILQIDGGQRRVLTIDKPVRRGVRYREAEAERHWT